MIHGRAPRVPMPVAVAHALLLALATWAYFVAFHQMSRALVGGFGSPASTVVLATVGTLMGALPLLALLPVALLPRWWFGRRRPERRIERSQCPDCGYPAARFPCPECGGDGATSDFDLFDRRPLARMLLALAAVFALAVAWAEFHVRLDEARFRQEVDARLAAGVREPMSRDREGWGAFGSLLYDPASGFAAPPPFEHPRIPGWQPAGGRGTP